MKQTIVFVLIGILMLAPCLYAGDGGRVCPTDNPATKLGRGFANIVLAPGEYIVQTNKLMATHDPVTAYCGGFAQGTWRMLQRIGGGVYELVTFPIPLPAKYRPLMDPATTAEALDDSGVLKAN